MKKHWLIYKLFFKRKKFQTALFLKSKNHLCLSFKRRICEPTVYLGERGMRDQGEWVRWGILKSQNKSGISSPLRATDPWCYYLNNLHNVHWRSGNGSTTPTEALREKKGKDSRLLLEATCRQLKLILQLPGTVHFKCG